MTRQKREGVQGIVALLCVVSAALPARAFRGEAADTVLRPEQAGAAQAGLRSPAQAAAAQAAAQAGVSVTWHSKRSAPLSVRGPDLGRRMPFSGGQGLVPKGGGAFAEDAVAVLDNLSRLYQIQDASREFSARRVDADKLGHRHVRLAQTYRRLRVVGGDLIVHFDARGAAYEVNGSYVPGMSLDVTPGIDPEDAVRVARQELAGLGLPEGELKQAPELVVLARDVEPALAYELTLAYEKGPSGPGCWQVWVDARLAVVLQRHNRLMRIAAPTENGEAAILSGFRLAGENGTRTNVTGWLEGTGAYYMYNPDLKWLVANVSNSPLYPDRETYAYRLTDDWGTSDRTEVSTAHGFETIQRYYSGVHGRNSYDDGGVIAQVNVHEGVNYVNGYWSPMDQQFFIGDGDGMTANSLAVLDVLAHEFTHAVTEHTADLIYMNESGALNESFSDIFGTCVEFYGQVDDSASYPFKHAGQADWLCGEDCWLSSTALRDLKNPANTATVGAGNEQPSKYLGAHWYSGLGDNGGVHINSGVQNFFFYLLCAGGTGMNDGTVYNVSGIGVTNAEQIAYRVLTVYCTPDTDYEAVAQHWRSAAQDLNPEWVPSVRQAWNAVLGVAPPVISAPSDLPTGRVGTYYSYTLGAYGGTPPYDWSVIDGVLPVDLTLVDGLLSGMPEEEGTFPFKVVLTDSNGLTATNACTLVINPVLSAPFNETFENGGLRPDSWAQEYVTGSLSWTYRAGSPKGYPAVAHGGSYNACLYAAVTNRPTTRLVSPRIDFGPYPQAARLSFWCAMKPWYGSQDELRVYYKTSYEEEWTLLATYTEALSVWTQRTLDLPDPGRTYYVAFEGTARYGYGLCIDDVQIWDPTPPLGITTASPLPEARKDVAYSVTLEAQGGEAPYIYSLVSGALPSGLALSEDGVISGVPDTKQDAEFVIQLEDLNGSTAFKVFTLTVAVLRADLFFENFETLNIGGGLPAGWTQASVTNGVDWVVQGGGKFGHPATAHTGALNALLWAPGTGVDHKTRLISPAIDLGQAPAAVRLTFWHAMEAWASDQDELRVYCRRSAAAPWTLLATFADSTPAWTQRSLLLPNPSSTYYLAFEGNARVGYGVCLDDISISDEAEAPIITTGARLPDGIVALPYSATFAAVGGTAPYAWQVVEGGLPSGLSFDGATGALSGTPPDATNVSFRVCVQGGDGLASTNLFTLKISSTRPIPFTETFENGGAMPAGWTRAQVQGVTDWKYRAGSASGRPAAAHGGQYNANLYFAARSAQITRLITPKLNLGTNTPNTRLTFWHYMEAWGSDRDELRVYYRGSEAAAWTLLATYTNSVARWTEQTVALPNPTEEYFVMFEGKAKYGRGVCLDDVVVTGDLPARYDTWKSAHFTSTELEQEPSAFNWDDPDGDGVPNGLEYAMGLDPKTPDAAGQPAGGLEDEFLTYTYRENKEATDVTFAVEACTSLSLQDWTTSGVTEISRADSNTWTQVTVRHDTPVTTAPRRFLRLKVNLP